MVRGRIIQLLSLSCMVLIILTSCGGGSGGNADRTGSLAFSLSMAQTAAESSPTYAGDTLTPVSCDEYGIDTIEALVYDENGTLIAQGGPWPCSVHEGMFSGIKAGINRTVKIILRDARQAIILQSEQTGVTFLAGQITCIDFDNLFPEETPTANNDQATGYNGDTITTLSSGDVTYSSVLWNDSGVGLTVNTTPVIPPQHGELLKLNEDGTFQYVHRDYGQSDSFTYEATDKYGRSVQAKVIISIANKAPLLDSQALILDGCSIMFSVHYLDPDGINPPASAKIYLGDQSYNMTRSSGTDVDGIYTYTSYDVSILTSCCINYYYYFYFQDDLGGFARLPETGTFSFH